MTYFRAMVTPHPNNGARRRDKTMAKFTELQNEGHFTHPVKAESVVALYFYEAEYQCQLHKAGCGRRSQRVRRLTG